MATACSKSGLHSSFEGILPCADCPGLQAEITINTDGTFYMEETYLESGVDPIITEGFWVIGDDIITFTSGDYQFTYLLISQDEIRWAPWGMEITCTDVNWSLMRK